MKRNIITSFCLGVAALVTIGFFSLSALLVNTSIASFSQAKSMFIDGEVFYHPKMALPEHANLIVQLVDVIDNDGAVSIVSDFDDHPKGQAPIAFKIPINNQNLKPDHKYALQARIMVGDILWFVSDARLPIDINNLAPNYQLSLAAVDHAIGSVKAAAPTLINTGHEWIVEDIFSGGIIDASHISILVEEKPENIETSDILKYKVSGSGGCNRYTTTVSINKDAGTISFMPPAMTFISCADAISQQENRFIDMLEKAKSYDFDEVGRLFIKDTQGNAIARLVPSL